jgi:hypothetical protein
MDEDDENGPVLGRWRGAVSGGVIEHVKASGARGGHDCDPVAVEVAIDRRG